MFYKDSALLPTSGVSDNRLRVIAEEYALVIGHLRKTDEGSYRCQGNNSVGSNHFEIKLIVHGMNAHFTTYKFYDISKSL